VRPGTDQTTLRALRRDPWKIVIFPRTFWSCSRYWAPVKPGQAVRAVPGYGTEVPIWNPRIEARSALELAAAWNCLYAFASHFAPAALIDASRHLPKRIQAVETAGTPYAMVGVNVVAGDTAKRRDI